MRIAAPLVHTRSSARATTTEPSTVDSSTRRTPMIRRESRHDGGRSRDAVVVGRSVMGTDCG